jgi:hypothetical protein
MRKDNKTKKCRINLVSLPILLLFLVGMSSVHGQESPAAKVPPSSAVKFQVTEHGHPWRPPYGVDRVGQSYDIIVNIQSKELPVGEFVLVSYSHGKELSKKTIQLTNKIPFSGRMPKAEEADQFAIYFIGSQAITEKTGNTFNGRAPMIENTDQVALLYTTNGKDPVELARQEVNLPSLEAEAVARPDKVINPIDLNSILVPANWLLLAGGQKAYVTVAVLNRDNRITNGRVTAWYNSSPNYKVNEPLPLSQGNKVQKELLLPECSKTLEKDILHVSVQNSDGKELWHEQIKVMIVPNPPVLPSFGALKTKLRYDSPVINIVNGKNVPLNYNELWKPEFEDVVVCLPNGSRWVFWRGTSYIPIWAAQHNIGLSYQWAERGFPRGDFVDCIEPLMDKELRWSRVEIVESTNARIHVRWSYQSCDFNYKVNGDLAVEDYYFYPDGLGTRVLELATVPDGEYEITEFIIIAPPAAFPLDFLPFLPVDIISTNTHEKASINLPEWFALNEANQPWKKIHGPSMYRIRLHKEEPLSAIIYSPNLTTETYHPVKKPYTFGPFFDNGYMVTPAYWGGHWPLSRGFMTMWSINESIWTAPSHNSLTTYSLSRPKPIKSAIVDTKDAFGIVKPMKIETWAWLIGMTDANDDGLLQLAQSYAKPPALDLTGAKQDQEPYSFESRAMRLVVDNKNVTIKIKPEGWCINPVFELKNAPKKLQEIKLEGKPLPTDKYAWDGNTLWLNAKINQPEMLQLLFKD